MNTEKRNYIEEAGLAFEKFGMTRMTGRVMGYLMICDKDAVSFDEIRDAIQASKGSISGTLKVLTQIGFAEPVSLPGDRKTYYRAGKASAGNLIKARLQLFDLFSGLLQKGLKLKDRQDDTSDWILELAAFYAWIGDHMLTIINSWEEEKEEVIETYRKSRNL